MHDTYLEVADESVQAECVERMASALAVALSGINNPTQEQWRLAAKAALATVLEVLTTTKVPSK